MRKRLQWVSATTRCVHACMCHFVVTAASPLPQVPFAPEFSKTGKCKKKCTLLNPVTFFAAGAMCARSQKAKPHTKWCPDAAVSQSESIRSATQNMTYVEYVCCRCPLRWCSSRPASAKRSAAPLAGLATCNQQLCLLQVPFALIFTKTDKRKKKCPGAAENIAAFQGQLLADWEVRVIALSCQAGTCSIECLALTWQLCGCVSDNAASVRISPGAMPRFR